MSFLKIDNLYSNALGLALMYIQTGVSKEKLSSCCLDTSGKFWKRLQMHKQSSDGLCSIFGLSRLSCQAKLSRINQDLDTFTFSPFLISFFYQIN